MFLKSTRRHFSRTEIENPRDDGAYGLAANDYARGRCRGWQSGGGFGSINFVSSVTQPSLEEIAAATTMAKIFQFYIRGDLDWCAGIIERVKKPATWRSVLTVDTAHYSRRERPLLNRWQPPSRASGGRPYFSGDAHLGDGGAMKKSPACR